MRQLAGSTPDGVLDDVPILTFNRGEAVASDMTVRRVSTLSFIVEVTLLERCSKKRFP